MKLPSPIDQGKTLFCPAPGTRAIPVTEKAGRRRRRVIKFTDAHAALDWAIAHNAALIYFQATSAAHN